MPLHVVEGDLLDQPVDVIVNPWNRNIIPWWLLVPQGVSGAIKKRGGLEPFREVARAGPIPLGGAVSTGAGGLPFKAIIHVAGINLWWRASRKSVQDSTRNALGKAVEIGARSVAMPLIGAGTGGARPAEVERWMTQAAAEAAFPGEVLIVRYRRPLTGGAMEPSPHSPRTTGSYLKGLSPDQILEGIDPADHAESASDLCFPSRGRPMRIVGAARCHRTGPEFTGVRAWQQRHQAR